MLGAWVALGSGELERELRVGLRLEQSLEHQEMENFQLFARSPFEAAELHRQIQEHRTAIGLAGIAESRPYDAQASSAALA